MVSVQMRKVSGSLLDLREVFALEPLGGELDRGQRVLDLVRDAARDVGPGGLALGRLEFGDVVEGHDEADRLALDTLADDAHQQGAAAALRAS